MSDESPAEQCDFCSLPRPAGTIEAEVRGDTYAFCSEHCRDAMVGADRVFTKYHGHRRFDPGVAAIDSVLPQGCPRNAFLLCSAQAGTRAGALQAELVWRALQREEPAVLVTFQEPPSSVVERFVTLDWNVLPYLESGQLRVVDCFSYRMDDRGRRREEEGSPWNSHLADAVEPATERVRDPTDVEEVTNKLESALDGDGGGERMIECGVVVIDSLTEFGTLVQPVQAYDFVKDVRADVCKARFVPIFAGATYGGDADAFPHDLAYVADGLIDCKLDGDIVEDGLVKRLRVRKLDGVLSYQRWIAYEFTAGKGLVPFDPQAEIEKNEGSEGAADADDDPTGDTPESTDGESDAGDVPPDSTDASGADDPRGPPHDEPGRPAAADEDESGGDDAGGEDESEDDGDGDDDGEDDTGKDDADE